MSDVEIAIVYSDSLTRDTLRAKLAEFPSNSSIKITNIPDDKIKSLRMNMTLSGYIGVKIIDGGVIQSNTPKVSE